MSTSELIAKEVTALPESEQRPEMMASVMASWAQISPNEAATYAGQLPPALQESAVRAVLQAYAEQDPATGAKWLQAFTDDDLRGNAQSVFVSQWAQQDAVAVGEWLRSQPESPSRQAAIEEFTRAVVSREPASAWEWAGSVASEENRLTLQRQVMERWLRVDPGAALRAMEQVNWSEETKNEFRGGH